MTAHDRKLRLALAVFEATVSLGPVVTALMQMGVPLSRIGLIVRAGGLRDLSPADAANTSSGDSPLLALARGLHPVSDTPGNEEILASPCLVDPWHSGLHLPALWGVRAPAQPEPRLASDLERHVRAGSVILAVESLSPREQWLCTRVLLQQNSSSVLALECSLPPSEADG